jgi:hypothetical protein
MAATKKTKDYTNRKVDILILDGEYTSSVFDLSQSLYDSARPSGKVCAGIQKLVQRWFIEFMTPLGSMPYLKARGSNFINVVRSGRLRTESDVTAAFKFANAGVAFNLRAEDAKGEYPNDEKYSDAELLSVKLVIGNQVSLSVRVDSLEGASRIFVVPITVTPSR